MTGRFASVTPTALPRLVLAVGVVAALHVALLHRIAPFGVVPGTLMAFTAVVAVETGPDLGAAAGFLAGLAVNVFDIDSVIGLPSLLFCIMGWIVGRARDRVFPGAERVPFALVALSSFCTSAVYGLLLQGARNPNAASVRELAFVAIVSLVLNPVIAVIIGPIVRLVLKVNWNEP